MDVAAVLSPLRGFVSSCLPPTAFAVGCILSPLRGWNSGQIICMDLLWPLEFGGSDSHCRGSASVPQLRGWLAAGA